MTNTTRRQKNNKNKNNKNNTNNNNNNNASTITRKRISEHILMDENTSTSYEFQLYNFFVGILFLAFGLNLISGSMMLLNICIAFVHLDLGFTSYDAMQLWNRIQIILGLAGLVFLYVGLLYSAGESIVQEGFTGPGLLLLIGVVGAETQLWDVCRQAAATSTRPRLEKGQDASTITNTK
ncbi:unnamed protein product [Cylindrotheca closterium]|uniref:Uncharacterized protein n=1 Tax=Cylindrotheca closterium TaxID=2856 RepID=A0AAD2FW52_9STRA|nr:unnamed protein product [Cylindrotheca closterium]